MIKKENINNWVNEALNSLDDVKKATGKPYLLTRLNAKIQNNSSSVWDNVLQFISKPLIAAACMLVVVAVNVIVIAKNYNTNATPINDQIVGVDEYNTNITALNYTENIEP